MKSNMAGRQGEITCAVAGLGRIGSSLEKDTRREKPCTHTGAIAGNPDCVLVAGCDTDPDARERFRTDWACLSPAPGLFDSVDALLEELVPQVLVVATYPESHYSIVKKAAAAGVPVILCEKPMAHTLRDARKIAALHRYGAATVLVNHERRYSSDYLGVREAVAGKRYGKLISVRGTLYFGRTARHKDVLLHDGTHLVDIINFLLEAVPGASDRNPRGITPVRLKRRFGVMRSSRSSAYLFDTASCAGTGVSSKVPVVIEVGAERDHLVFEVELSFESGRIRVGNGVLSFEKSGESPYYEGYRSLLPDEVPVIGKTGYFSNMIADAVRCVKLGREAGAHRASSRGRPEPGNQGYEPVSSAEDGYEVMKFIRSMRGLL